jgi:hypothetical protein
MPCSIISDHVCGCMSLDAGDHVDATGPGLYIYDPAHRHCLRVRCEQNEQLGLLWQARAATVAIAHACRHSDRQTCTYCSFLRLRIFVSFICLFILSNFSELSDLSDSFVCLGFLSTWFVCFFCSIRLGLLLQAGALGGDL